MRIGSTLQVEELRPLIPNVPFHPSPSSQDKFMALVVVLDRYCLAITSLIIVIYQFPGFAVAGIFHFDKITDFTGGWNSSTRGSF